MPDTESGLPSFIEDPFKDQVQNIVDLSAETQEFFPGQTFANLTPDQLQAFQLTRDAAGTTGLNIDNALTSNAFLADTNALFSGVENIPGVSNFINSIIGDSSQTLGETLLPQLRSGAVLSGSLGGSRPQIGEALATERVNQDALDSISEFGLNLFAPLLAANTAALDRTPQLTDAAFTPADKLSGIGKTQQQQDQLAIDEAVARFEFTQNEPFQDINNILDVLGIGDAGSTFGTQDFQDPAFIDQLLGGLTVLLGTETGTKLFGDILKKIPGLFGGGDDGGIPSTEIDPSQP
jgi:hypothetical protein